MGLDFPSKIINSPDFAPILGKVFSYCADVYDLEAYEAVKPGFGKRIWDLVCAERDLQEAQRRFARPIFLESVLG